MSWAYVGPTSRWTTIWGTKGKGYVGLNAFISGAWSITKASEATDENPYGIVASSWHDGPVCNTLEDAMKAAEAKAAELGAFPMYENHSPANG